MWPLYNRLMDSTSNHFVGNWGEGEEKKRVCIIGGGPSGLVSLRRVLNSPCLTGTIFEQKDDVGGVWNYKQGTKGFGVSSKNLSGEGGGVEGGGSDPECTTNMYDDLTCNFPYPLMQFLDFPHANPPRTFLTQQEVHEYLRSYANHFHLWPHIQLNTSVISVRPEHPITPSNLGEPGRWLVKTHNHSTDIYTTSVFDAVIVCTGKNNYPYQPTPTTLPGLDKFQGEMLHSKFYKNPEHFKDKSVVLIGLGPSSADLTLHISKTAKSVTVCHKAGGGFGLGLVPPNVRETRNVKMVTESGVITEEDEEVACDTIIFCTGYGIRLPFFREREDEEGSGGVLQVLGEKYIPNLYKMMIFTKRPSLAVLNLCYRSPELIVVEAQVMYFIRALEGYHVGGRFKLPPYQQMQAAVTTEEEERRSKDIPYSLWFQVGEYGKGTWNHFMKLAQEIGMEEELCCWRWPLLEQLTTHVFLKRIFGKLALYKKDAFRYVSGHVWEYTSSADKHQFPESEGEKVTMTLDKETGVVTVEASRLEN